MYSICTWLLPHTGASFPEWPCSVSLPYTYCICIHRAKDQHSFVAFSTSKPCKRNNEAQKEQLRTILLSYYWRPKTSSSWLCQQQGTDSPWTFTPCNHEKPDITTQVQIINQHLFYSHCIQSKHGHHLLYINDYARNNLKTRHHFLICKKSLKILIGSTWKCPRDEHTVLLLTKHLQIERVPEVYESISCNSQLPILDFHQIGWQNMLPHMWKCLKKRKNSKDKSSLLICNFSRRCFQLLKLAAKD